MQRLSRRISFESQSNSDQYSFLDVQQPPALILDDLERNVSVESIFLQEPTSPVEEMWVLCHGPDARRLCYMPCEWTDCTASLNCLEALIHHVDRIHVKRPENTRRLQCDWLLCQAPKFRTIHGFSNHIAEHILAKRYCMYRGCDAVMREDLVQIHSDENHRFDKLKPLVDRLIVPRSPIIPQKWNVSEHQIVQGFLKARCPSSPPPSQGMFIPSIRTPTACLEGRQRDDFDFLDPFHNLLHLDLNLGLANLESRFNAEANEARALKQNA